MSDSVYKPSYDELNYFIAASIAMGVAYLAYFSNYEYNQVLFISVATASILLAREIGQRLIAHWMEAKVELKLAIDGTFLTFFGGIFSALTSLPVILLFPIYNEYDVEDYEQWGKSIDAMWIKRKYWIVSGGILSLFSYWFIAQRYISNNLAIMVSLFLIFQLLPFDYSNIPTGRLDGSIVLRWSGFVWLIFMGSAILSLLII